MIHSDYLSSMEHGTQRACQLQWYSTKIFPNISESSLWPSFAVAERGIGRAHNSWKAASILSDGKWLSAMI